MWNIFNIAEVMYIVTFVLQHIVPQNIAASLLKKSEDRYLIFKNVS